MIDTRIWYLTENHRDFLGPYPSLESAERALEGSSLSDDFFVVPEDVMRRDRRERFVGAAKGAFTVQDACNLSGVSKSFADTIDDVRAYLRTEGREDEYRTHPVVTLWLYKLMDLCGVWSCNPDEYTAALRACEAIARGDDIAAPAAEAAEPIAATETFAPINDADASDDAARVAAAHQGFGMGVGPQV
jgi:hypothetical protein